MTDETVTKFRCKMCYKTFDERSDVRTHIKRHNPRVPMGKELVPSRYWRQVDTTPRTDEQRDFAGETPSSDEHDPEHEATNEPPETQRTSLREYVGGDDE